MRTTINLNDDLLTEAKSLSGITGRAALVNEAIKALIQRESAKRLARLEGCQPDLEAIPRRRIQYA